LLVGGRGGAVNLLEIYFCDLGGFIAVFGKAENLMMGRKIKRNVKICMREKKERVNRRKGIRKMKVRNNGAGKNCWKGGTEIELFKE
jgi:hypothetical protein